MVDKKGDLTLSELMLMLLALAFLVWLLFFDNTLSTLIKDTVKQLLGLGK